MDQNTTGLGFTYHIRIKETLDRSPVHWFGNITVIPQDNGETLLRGKFADQPALRGLVDQLWNLNFTVLYLERIENGDAA
jgi:hypothetical protein